MTNITNAFRAYQKEMADEEKSKQLSDDDKAQIEENYTRRVIAAHREMNAELQAQAKRDARQACGGSSKVLFKNPRDYFKNMGTHMMAGVCRCGIDASTEAHARRGGNAGSR